MIANAELVGYLNQRVEVVPGDEFSEVDMTVYLPLWEADMLHHVMMKSKRILLLLEMGDANVYNDGCYVKNIQRLSDGSTILSLLLEKLPEALTNKIHWESEGF